MNNSKTLLPLAAALALALPVQAEDQDATMRGLMDELQALRERVEQLEAQLEQRRDEQADIKQETREVAREAAIEAADARYAAAEEAAAETGIEVGGAVRFQYAYRDFSELNKNVDGVFELDTFRINAEGTVGDVILSGEYRFYQYMRVLHHAWVGYDFSDSVQAQLGVHQVPFGITPYNSHNFFFSSNYYLGLEDDYDAGIKVIYDKGPWNLQGAFYANDELGGADGYLGFDPDIDDPDNLNDRYSYDVIATRTPGSLPGDNTFDRPQAGLFAFESNTWNGRIAYTFEHGTDLSTALGVSGQYGDMVDGSGDGVGDQSAYAVHLVGNYGRWNLQLQALEYEYDMDNGADRMVVGAYDFFDTIPAEARTYTANLAYSLPVSIGPISNLTFYNDYSLITDKSADLADTWMNVLGVAVTSGGLYTYIDWVRAENQPFIGGTFDSSTDGDVNNRFNINFGYYF